MTLSCPHRHVSYATWRLQVFRQLFAIAESDNGRFEISQRRGFRFRKVPAGSRTIPKYERKPEPRDEQQDIKEMIADLESMIKDGDNTGSGKGNRKGRTRVDELEPSPLERRLRSRETSSKPSATRSTSDHRITTNAWANILASPIRQCQASKARLPRSLMMTWGVMQNPNNEQDYLLPVELSDVKRLEKQMLNDKEDWIDLWRDKQKRKLKAADRDNKSRTEAGVEDFVVPKNTEGARVYIQPDRNLIDAMTEAFTKKDMKTGEITGTNSRVLSSMMVPAHWRQKMEMAATFERTGRNADLHVDEPNSARGDEEDVADFTNLQWQPDIGVRTRAIMSERIMVSLEGIARRPNRRQPLWTRKVVAMDLPTNGKMKIISNRAFVEEMVVEGPSEGLPVQSGQKVSTGSTISSDQHSIQQESPNLQDALSTLFLTDPPQSTKMEGQKRESLASDTLENTAEVESETSAIEMEHLRDKSGKIKPSFWPSGSILLHIGSPSQYRATIEKWHAMSPSKAPHHPLVPPTVSVNDEFNLPIFNLLTLMGPTVADRLEAVTHGYTAFDYGFWADLIRNIDDKYSLNEILEEAAAKMSDPERQIDKPNDLKSSSLSRNKNSIEDEDGHNIAEEQEARKQGFIRLKYKDDVEDTEAHSEREYMVLIKGSMYQAPELIMEIWRLWRYVGGRNGIWLGDLIRDREGKREFMGEDVDDLDYSEEDDVDLDIDVHPEDTEDKRSDGDDHENLKW